MRARKCDRCSKLYEHYDGREKFGDTEEANALTLIDRDLNNRYSTHRIFDLCPNCMEKLEMFLRNEFLRNEE